MKISISIAIIGACLTAGFPAAVSASPVDLRTATEVAAAAVSGRGCSAVTYHLLTFDLEDRPLFFVFELEPVGFVVVAGNTDLPPVIAYSFLDEFPHDSPEGDTLLGILQTDLALRLEQLSAMPEDKLEDRRLAWERLSDPTSHAQPRLGFEQWPPAGSTATGGWLEKNWHQNSPYNDQCPMDSVAGGRSAAGCPSVAIALILDFHQGTNGTQFNDTDDYFHSYAGRQYWIDDDWATNGFPSFPTLSASMAVLEDHYRNQIPATDADAAALVFACGVAATQVYTASISGTFGVAQAVDAYLRFGVEGSELLDDSDPDLYVRLSTNMKWARPAHLAVVDPAGSAGHNLVVDGYNTDGYFHLNFGWGGSANGWYLIPDEIPYNLTVIEGVIVDITLPIFTDGFESGSLSEWS